MAREDGGRAVILTNQAQAWTRPGEAVFFGPAGEPTLPSSPEEAPRVFEYQPGINLATLPRQGFGLASFSTLRNLALACKEIRLNIEMLKREVRALNWDIAPAREEDPNKEQYEPEIEETRRALMRPDGYLDFDQWINQLLEELLVVDAVTIWPERTRDGKVDALELVDGTTIRPLLDVRGRVPLSGPAYVQVLHGTPTACFERERLLYAPFNTTVYSPYGISPTEFVLLMVSLALRRDVSHVARFTEGNVPEALVGAPSSWTQRQVDEWQEYWDALVAGNVVQQRRMHFVPLEGGRGNVPVYEFRPDDSDKVVVDEWLMRLACWAFGNSPGEFGLTGGSAMGLGGKGFSEAQENIQYRTGLGPITQYVQSMMTRIVAEWYGKPHLKFIWVGLDPKKNELRQAQVDEIYIRAGVYSPDTVRLRLGMSALGIPVTVSTPAGPMRWEQVGESVDRAGGGVLPDEFFRTLPYP
jgi:hypothetical protein